MTSKNVSSPTLMMHGHMNLKYAVKSNVTIVFTEISNLQIQTLQYMNFEFRSLF